jgi:hypothetical protein
MFDKDPFKEFDKRHDKMQRQFWAAWWIMALVGIAFTGAIISLFAGPEVHVTYKGGLPFFSLDFNKAVK